MINWNDDTTYMLYNPRMPEEEKYHVEKLEQKASSFPGHCWLATSGSTAESTQELKWAALSKKALLASAEVVNQHLKSDSTDIWVNALPIFHIGGLSIWARAHLSGAQVVEKIEKWNPESYCQTITEAQGTLTSLVPAQVYDLVSLQLKAPKTLRAIIVGGGALRPTLYTQARELGWPLLPSYGLTECSSQVATADLHSLSSLEFPSLQILPHVKVTMSAAGTFRIQSDALLSAYGYTSLDGVRVVDLKVMGWFQTEDRGIIEGNKLKIMGRDADFIKIGGENVNLSRLEGVFDEVKDQLNISGDAALIAFPDDRLGHCIHLAVSQMNPLDIQRLLSSFHERILPYERIRSVHVLTSIPRSPLNKVLRG